MTPHEATPLKLTKTLWLRKYTKKGPVLEPVRGPIEVGDEVVVRVELRTDRDMEYVHLGKTPAVQALEPKNVLSRYRYQDGLAYYETTRDTASHFFIDYLPKGVYVFEYSVQAVLKGQYPTGMAEIQCMYAPEFNSHSESISADRAVMRETNGMRNEMLHSVLACPSVGFPGEEPRWDRVSREHLRKPFRSRLNVLTST